MSSYIGRININNTEYPIAQSLFGTCNTTANTATKVVTCADFDTLISGIVINVYFTYANTSTSISLNVNSTGNKDVYTDSNSSILWEAGATKSFVYYDNKWRLVNPTSVGTTYSAATTAAAGLMSAMDKIKLNSVASSAEVNQNAFSNVIVGSSTVLADSKTDSLTLVGSGSVSLTANTSTDTITISGTNTTYSAATTAAAGLMSADDKKKLNSVASSATYNLAFKTVKVGTTDLVADVVDDTLTITAGNNIILTPTASSDSFSIAATNTTYAIATTAADGLMSASDKIKLNGVPTSAFKTIKVGSTNLVADSALDTLTITAGDNITLTPTASSDSFSISATNTTYGTVTSTSNGLMSAADKQALDNLVSDGGLPNQNAFSNVVVGSSTVAADQKTDTLTLVGSGSVSLSANTSTDTITISGTDTTYTAGTGLTASGTTINHSNSITASSVGSSVATSGATLDVPYAKYDAQGHITAKGTHVHTIGSLAASAITSGTFATARIPSLPASIITSGTFATARIPSLPASIITSGTFATAQIPSLPTSIITSGTFSTARLPVSTSVGNDNNLPTGAAVQTYVTGLGYGKGTVGGTGTASYIAKWSGSTVILNGPMLGGSSATTKYLREDGTWAVPLGSESVSLEGVVRGVKILSTNSNVTQPSGQIPVWMITHNLGTTLFMEKVWVSGDGSTYTQAKLLPETTLLEVGSDSNTYYNITNVAENSFYIRFSNNLDFTSFKILLFTLADFTDGDNINYGGN